MAHDHSHDDDTYHLEQVCTIVVCAAIGMVTIRLAQRNLLFFLADWLHVWIYAGGIALVILAAIRALPLVFSALARRRTSAALTAAKAHSHGHNHVHEHGHDHAHGECDHNHDHADCGHDHGNGDAHTHSHGQDDADCGHDHGWAPWRYVVLLLPVVLYFLDMPSEGFSVQTVNTQLAEGGTNAARKEGVVSGFLELERAAYSEQTRLNYAGQTAQVVGQVAKSNERNRFGLTRYKMSCCAADAVQLNMIVEVSEVDEAGKTFNARAFQSKWVEIEGTIQFRKLLKDGSYITILQVKASDIQPIEMPNNPFVY
jgi:hypothetical protein